MLAFMLCGAYAKGGLAEDDDIYVAMNMDWKNHLFHLPQLLVRLRPLWHRETNEPADMANVLRGHTQRDV